MATNRNALIRYRTIDKCLRDTENTYHLKDLISACSEAISEYAGHDVEVKRRTIMYDLQFMKDDKTGFNAPIEHDRVDGYYYSSRFSIFSTPIQQSDVEVLKYTLQELQQISGKKGFEDVDSVITRLEEAYNMRRSRNARSAVQFEHSTNIEGQKHVGLLKNYIRDEQALKIKYEPFDENPYTRFVCPYLLKEYNNRWFLIAFEFDSPWGMTVLALDRIKSITKSLRTFEKDPSFDPDTYHNDIIGVTFNSDAVKTEVVFRAHRKARHYFRTKPVHHSQRILKTGKKYIDFSIEVIPNKELESRLLAYADQVEVRKPQELRERLAKRIDDARKLYQSKKKKKKDGRKQKS